MWAGMDSQKTVGVSPDLFHEFILSGGNVRARLLGMLRTGTSDLGNIDQQTLPNLKTVSISRWADERFMAEARALHD